MWSRVQGGCPHRGVVTGRGRVLVPCGAECRAGPPTGYSSVDAGPPSRLEAPVTGDARPTFVTFDFGKSDCSSVALARPAVTKMGYKTTNLVLTLVLILRAINSTEGEFQKDIEELLSRMI